MAKDSPAALVGHSEHGHTEHHITPMRSLVGTLLALLVFMGLTIAASYWDAPGGTVVNNVIALVIATIKALFVIFIFMGVKWQTTLAKVWVVAGFLVLLVMFGIFGDYWTRKFEPVAGWEKAGESAFPREFAPANQPPVPNNVNLRPRG
jgi:cytochrome c oxidase subunit IV